MKHLSSFCFLQVVTYELTNILLETKNKKNWEEILSFKCKGIFLQETLVLLLFPPGHLISEEHGIIGKVIDYLQSQKNRDGKLSKYIYGPSFASKTTKEQATPLTLCLRTYLEPTNSSINKISG